MATPEQERLIERGHRVMHQCIFGGVACLVMTAPGFLLWQNGLERHMSAWLTYSPLVVSGGMLICSGVGFFIAYRISRSIKELKMLK